MDFPSKTNIFYRVINFLICTVSETIRLEMINRSELPFPSSDLSSVRLIQHFLLHRYIEIFKSSLKEARDAMCMMQRMSGGGRMGMNRPGPYDRVDRFGGGGGGMGGFGGGGGMGGGMGPYGPRGKGRNIKGEL